MTIPFLKADDFIQYLTTHGMRVVSNDYLDDCRRIILSKDGDDLFLQYKDTYYYPQVVKICDQFDIPAPPDHRKCYDQHLAILKKQNGKNSKKQ